MIFYRLCVIDNNKSNLHISYFFDDFNSGSTDPNPGHTYFSDGMHYPTQIVFNQFGCSDTTFRSITIEPFVVYVPNTFTPDGNEHNNDFYPKMGLEPVEWDMKIFNRWGELVFESRDTQVGWDGTYAGGGMSQVGIYIWVIRFKDDDNDQKYEFTGHLNLQR